MKDMQMNIPHFCFTLINCKFSGEIITNYLSVFFRSIKIAFFSMSFDIYLAFFRMKKRLNDEGWMAPGRSTESTVVNNPLLPLTTGLSPYFSFGCLSTRLFFHVIRNVKAEVRTCLNFFYFFI